MSLILKRTMIIFFLCVTSVPFFMDTFYYSRYEMIEECFRTFYNSLLRQGLPTFTPLQLRTIFQRFVNTTTKFQETPLILFQSKYYNYSSEDMTLFRITD